MGLVHPWKGCRYEGRCLQAGPFCPAVFLSCAYFYYFELFELGVAAVNPKEDMEWFPQVGSFLWIDDRRKEQFQKLSLTLKLCLRASHA